MGWTLTWVTNNGPTTFVLYTLIMSSGVADARVDCGITPALFISRFRPEPFRWASAFFAAASTLAGSVASGGKENEREHGVYYDHDLVSVLILTEITSEINLVLC